MQSDRLNVNACFDWNKQMTKCHDRKEDSSDEEEKGKKSHSKAKRFKVKATIDEKEVEEHLSKLGKFDPKSPLFQELDTLEEYDRLVMTNPNSSKGWLLYMVYHLKQAEVDKARSVAQKALKTISFREEQDKFNVWVALLNLENLYGTQETLMHAFEQALSFNEPKKIYNHLTDLYIKYEKIEEAEQVLETMVKKYKHDKEAWIKFIVFCMQNKKAELGRKLVERSSKTLDKKSYVDVMGKMAHLEYEYGDSERSKSLFENIIQNYPKRKDILCVYINMLKKLGDQNEVQRLSSLLRKK